LEEALNDPDIHKDASPWPRLGVNLTRPYKHPDPRIEKIARRLYRTWAKAVDGSKFLPWKMYDPPCQGFRFNGHSGNGHTRTRFYAMAEMVLETLMCEDCADELHS
jgi:hypothetical protein